ncbi:hypothetical protein BDW69DRAFT_69393 [Aspergillus filifer]
MSLKIKSHSQTERWDIGHGFRNCGGSQLRDSSVADTAWLTGLMFLLLTPNKHYSQLLIDRPYGSTYYLNNSTIHPPTSSQGRLCILRVQRGSLGAWRTAGICPKDLDLVQVQRHRSMRQGSSTSTAAQTMQNCGKLKDEHVSRCLTELFISTRWEAGLGRVGTYVNL